VGHARRFRFGAIHEDPQPLDRWLAHVRRIEDLGFSTFLIRDHFVPDFFGDQPVPLVSLASAAGATARLRLGTMVLAVDYRHPVMLAKEAATLDVLSGGRLELGLGAGWLRREYEGAGIPFEPAGVRIEPGSPQAYRGRGPVTLSYRAWQGGADRCLASSVIRRRRALRAAWPSRPRGR
jgi:alkanesulfonate monooxygenase SsuD/methylene tetrahydromethanopterin reductase-like flavin-dependent oxidoreductase (luciferase family)